VVDEDCGAGAADLVQLAEKSRRRMTTATIC